MRTHMQTFLSRLLCLVVIVGSLAPIPAMAKGPVKYGTSPWIGLRLNNLDALDEVMVPYIDDVYGVDHVHLGHADLNEFEINYAPTTVTLAALLIMLDLGAALVSELAVSCTYNVDLDLTSFDMDLNIDHRTLTSEILEDQVLENEIVLRDMNTRIKVNLSAVGTAAVTLSGSPIAADDAAIHELLCPSFELPLNFGADGLRVVVETTWGFDMAKSKLRVSSIDFTRFQLQDVYLISGAITAIYDALAPIVDWLSSSVTCDSVDTCVSKIAQRHIRNNAGIQSDLRRVINKAVSHTLRMNDDVDDYQDLNFSYDVKLATKHLGARRQTLFTQWQTVLHSTAPKTTDCISNLTHNLPMRFTPDRIPGVSALDIVVPYGVLGDAIVIASDQGHFCSNPEELTFKNCKGTDVGVIMDLAGELGIVPGDTIDNGFLYVPIKIKFDPATGETSGYYQGLLRFEMSGHFDSINQIHSIEFGIPAWEELEPVVGPYGMVLVDGCSVNSELLETPLNNYRAGITIAPIVVPRVLPIASGSGSSADDRVYMEFEGALFENPVIRLGNAICHDGPDGTRCVR